MKYAVKLISSLLLAAAMLLPCVGCAQSGEGHETNTNPVGTIEDVTGEDPRSTLDNPEVNYGGYEFNVLSADYAKYFTPLDVEEMNGEAVNDSIYERNRTIEQLYGVKFSNDLLPYDQLLSAMERQVKAGGTDGYDLIMLICRNAYTATINNYLTDYSNLPYVDTEKEYYFEDLNRQFSIGGKTFFAFSAESVNVLSFANAIIFNKGIASRVGLPDLYSLVDNKEWTYAKMFEYADLVTTDSNGDGAVKYKDDLIGLMGDYDKIIPASWISAGEMLITKDEDDIPAYTAPGNVRLINILQDVLAHFATDYVYPFTAGDGKDEVFTNEKAFMLSTQVGQLSSIRSMTTDYGLLPWPMYDTIQGRYYSRAEDAWLHCVPTTCTDTERTSVILQALAYYSYRTVYDAYYSQALSTKYLRDARSVDMLKLILSTMIVDIGDNVWYEYIRLPLVGGINTSRGGTNVVSSLKRYEKVAQKQIKTALNFASKHE